MELVGVRALVLELNFSAHGLPATVTRPAPDETPIATRVVWIVNTPEDAPMGASFTRRAAIRVAAIRKNHVATLPVGTLIDAAVEDGATVQRWLVTDIDLQDVDHHRALVQAQGDD